MVYCCGIRNNYKYYILKSDAGIITSKLTNPVETMAFFPIYNDPLRKSIVINLFYNNYALDETDFGKKCYLNIRYHIYVDNSGYHLYNPDGSTEDFSLTPDNIYSSLETGRKLRVSAAYNIINSATLTLEDGTECYYHNNELIYPYRIKYPNGDVYNITYSQDCENIYSICMDNNVSITFEYNQQGFANNVKIYKYYNNGFQLVSRVVIYYNSNNYINRIDYDRHLGNNNYYTLNSSYISINNVQNDFEIMIADERTNKRIKSSYVHNSHTFTFSEGYDDAFTNGIFRYCIVKNSGYIFSDYKEAFYHYLIDTISLSITDKKNVNYSEFDTDAKTTKSIFNWNIRNEGNLIQDGFGEGDPTMWTVSATDVLFYQTNAEIFDEALETNLLGANLGNHSSFTFSQRVNHNFKNGDIISVSLLIEKTTAVSSGEYCDISIKDGTTVLNHYKYLGENGKRALIYFECEVFKSSNIYLVFNITGAHNEYLFDSILVRVNTRAYVEKYDYSDGNLITILSNGKKTHKTTYETNKISEVMTSSGNYEKNSYNNNLLASSSNYNRKSTCNYDSNNNLTQKDIESVDGLKLRENYSYENYYDLISKTDINGYTENYNYSSDGFRLLKRIEKPNNVFVGFDYNPYFGYIEKYKFGDSASSIIAKNTIVYSSPDYKRITAFKNANNTDLKIDYDSDDRIISYSGSRNGVDVALVSYEYMNVGTNLPHYPYIVGKKYGDGSYNKYVFGYNSDYLLNSINYIDPSGTTHSLFSFTYDNKGRLQNVNNYTYLKHYEYKNELIDCISLDNLYSQDGLNFYYDEESELIKEKQRISNSLILYGHNNINRSMNRSIDGLRYYVRHYESSNSRLYSNFYENKEIYSLSYSNKNGDDASDKISCSTNDGAVNSHHYVYNGVGCLKVNSSLGSVTYYISPNTSANDGRVFFNFLLESVSARTIAKISCGINYTIEFLITSVGYLSCRVKNSNNSVLGSKTISVNIMPNKWNSFGTSWRFEEDIIFLDIYLNKAHEEFAVDITNSLTIHNFELTTNTGDIYYTNVVIGKYWDYNDPLLHKLCSYAEEIMQIRYADTFNSENGVASSSSSLLYSPSIVDTNFYPLNNDLYNYYGACLGKITKNEDEVLDIDTAGDRDFVYDNKLKHYVLTLRRNNIKTNLAVENSGNILARVSTFREDNIDKKIFVFSDDFYLYVSQYDLLGLYFYGTYKNTYRVVSPEQFNTIGITWMRSVSSDSVPIVTYSFKVFMNNNISSFTIQSNSVITGNNIQIGDCCYLKMEMLFQGSAYLSDSSIYDYVNKTKVVTIANEYDTLDRPINYSIMKQNTAFYKKKYTYKKNGNYDTLQVASETDSLGNLYEYTYYDNGNLETIKINNTLYRTYYYNYANQLTKEILHNMSHDLQYNYDNALKNLSSVDALPTGISPITIINYNYEDGNINKPTSTSSFGNTKYITYSYDLKTNITSYNGYEYSYFGRKLVGIAHNGDAICYHYDEEGNRDKKVVNNNITYYYYSGGKLIAEVSTQLNKTIKFLYDETDYLFGFIYNGNTYYYLRDCFGIINGIIDDSNTLVVSYEYDAFGNSLRISGSLASTIGAINPFRYKGYYYDNESGLYYLKNRYYNPDLRMFMQADDVSYIDPNYINGLSLYCYCYNNPVMYEDPEGNGILSAILVGAAIGFLASYIPDVAKNIKDDGFQWTDFNTFNNGNVKKYLINTIAGGLTGLIGGLGLPIIYSAPLCGTVNSLAGVATGDVRNAEQFFQAFAIYTLLSGLTLGSQNLASRMKIVRCSGGLSKLSVFIDKMIYYTEKGFKFYGKHIDSAVGLLVGLITGAKEC